MISSKTLNIGRLHCPVQHLWEGTFFSLVDYRNNYFTSDDSNKIIEFYNGFENRDQLIQWMRERPKGVTNIHEVEGDNEIVVVITTADFNGKYAKDCRDNIFKGLHMVFVESGGKGDFYFNIAHNVNVGIRKAMEYNPQWIVYSGDDMVKIDSVTVLQKELLVLDNHKYDVVFTQPSKYHSSPEKISQPNILYYIYNLLTNNNYGKAAISIHKKFGVRYLMSPTSGKFSKLFSKGYQYIEIQDFGIFSPFWISNIGNALYEDNFINAAEDTDLSLKIALSEARIAKINYRIGDLIGSTLGTGRQRSLKSIAGLTYLNWKWANRIEEKLKGGI